MPKTMDCVKSLSTQSNCFFCFLKNLSLVKQEGEKHMKRNVGKEAG